MKSPAPAKMEQKPRGRGAPQQVASYRPFRARPGSRGVGSGKGGGFGTVNPHRGASLAADPGCQAQVVRVGMGKQDSLDVARNGTAACEMVAERTPVGGQSTVDQHQPCWLFDDIKVDRVVAEAMDGGRGEGWLLHDDSLGRIG
jgi:uncharacterized membrane protein